MLRVFERGALRIFDKKTHCVVQKNIIFNGKNVFEKWPLFSFCYMQVNHFSYLSFLPYVCSRVIVSDFQNLPSTNKRFKLF